MHPEANFLPNKLPVGLGMRVTLELITPEDTERLELHIVPDSQSDFRLGLLGESTPLARAIWGHTAGQTLPYPAGGGEIRLLQVTLPKASPKEDVAARRQETLRKAVEDSDRANAMIFASSFSGKWGDYDPNTITTDQAEQPDDPKEPS